MEAAARRYPVEIAEVETQVRQEKYVMATSTQTSQDQLKCILTITGDSITSAVIIFFYLTLFQTKKKVICFHKGHDIETS